MLADLYDIIHAVDIEIYIDITATIKFTVIRLEVVGHIYKYFIRFLFKFYELKCCERLFNDFFFFVFVFIYVCAVIHR